MDAFLHLGLAVLISTILSVLAYWFKLLTWTGAVSAFGVGIVIGFFGSLNWLLVLVSFTLVGFIVTKIGIRDKTEKGLQEGKHGERTHTNVLAVGIPPCLMAILTFITGEQGSLVAAIGYISIISVAASDTIASELGVRYQKVWLITNFKRVDPGTDGGISVMGTVWAILGALAASVLGWVVIYPDDIFNQLLLIPVLAGFIGCLLDSLLGATWESRGLINKYTNNAITMVLGGFIGILLFLILG